MRKLKIYWNNICLLRKKEEEFINDYFDNNKDISFDITYFGLGMPLKLKKQIVDDINESNDVNADLIVSTELDIFWDKNILRNKDIFVPLKDKFIINDYIKDSNVLKEYNNLTVPLLLLELIVINKELLGDLDFPQTLKDLTKDIYKGLIVIGGPDTAAGRIVVISIWYLYGIEYVLKFLDNVTFVKVPATALGLLKKGVYKIGILPSVLCPGDLTTIFPSDGVPAIPTYCAIHKKANLEDSLNFLKILFNIPMQEFYSKRANMLTSNKDCPLNDEFYVKGLPKIVYPSKEFLDTFDIQKFYELMDNIKV